MPKYSTNTGLNKLATRWEVLCRTAPEAKRRITFDTYASYSWPARTAFEADVLGSEVADAPADDWPGWLKALALLACVVAGAAIAVVFHLAR